MRGGPLNIKSFETRRPRKTAAERAERSQLFLSGGQDYGGAELYGAIFFVAADGVVDFVVDFRPASAGTRFSSGRNGVAIARCCSQASSTVPGQVQGTVRVSSWGLVNPFFVSAPERLPGREAEGIGVFGSEQWASDFAKDDADVVAKYGCSFGPQAAKQALAPGLRTRRSSRSADQCLGRTSRRSARWLDRIDRRRMGGSVRRLAECDVGEAALRARSAAMARRSALRSSAVTFPVGAIRVAMVMAGSPVPLARSRTSFQAGLGVSTRVSVTSRPMAADFAFHFSEAVRRKDMPQSGLGLVVMGAFKILTAKAARSE